MEFDRFVELTGQLAETLLILYRSIINSGASSDEAYNITKAWTAAMLETMQNKEEN